MMSAVSKESEDESEAAGTSSMMESTMMEGEEYYNPETTVAWTEKVPGAEQLCRICANTNEYLIPIFSGEGLEHQLGMKIEKHLPIQVVEEDKLPLHVCYQCASTLIAWHDLVIGCVEAEKKLRQVYQQRNEEEEEDGYADDDKTDFFDEPVDNEIAEDPLKPSTSASATTRSTRTPRKKTVTRAKPKLKMTLVKTPPAILPKSSSKLLQPKEEQVEPDAATERWQPSSTHSLTCLVCGQTFIRECYLRAHVERLHSFDETSKVELDQDVPLPFNAANIEKGESNDVFDIGVVNPKPTNIFLCVVCGKNFENKSNFQKHINLEHSHQFEDNNGGDNLKNCDNEIILIRVPKLELESDPENDDLNNEAEADSNDISAMSPGAQSNRRLNPKNPRAYKCNVCNKLFTRVYDMERHNQQKHSDSSYIRNNRKLNPKHPRSYECDLCSRSFTRHYDMLKHRKLKHPAASTMLLTEEDLGLLKLTDSDLGKASRETVPLLAIKRRTPRLYDKEEQEKIAKARVVVDGKTFFQCDVCGSHLGSKYSFVSHLRVHSGEKPFTCHVCGRQFRTSEQLQRHVSDVHDRVKRYGCHVCGRAFATFNTRNEHLHTHSQERTFVCHVCGKAFRSNGTLRVHQKLHLDVYPHQCPHCGKRFKMRQHYNTHLRVHTGDRPYPCGSCAKRFKSSSELKKHELIHTNTEKFHCVDCMKSYSQKRYLNNHRRLSHGVRGVVARVSS